MRVVLFESKTTLGAPYIHALRTSLQFYKSCSFLVYSFIPLQNHTEETVRNLTCDLVFLIDQEWNDTVKILIEKGIEVYSINVSDIVPKHCMIKNARTNELIVKSVSSKYTLDIGILTNRIDFPKGYVLILENENPTSAEQKWIFDTISEIWKSTSMKILMRCDNTSRRIRYKDMVDFSDTSKKSIQEDINSAEVVIAYNHPKLFYAIYRRVPFCCKKGIGCFAESLSMDIEDVPVINSFPQKDISDVHDCVDEVSKNHWSILELKECDLFPHIDLFENTKI
ncbi:hypothetical protein TetV_369 [Tetraselmis virus 1]|uniref:Uncharacterized protein n=1 Tax=Tetraselmis virus 1 TaxID=2060617 RepID=A0A2P0VNI5_9VIRU|nr:hypothetical protein QJ968_gp369 [Tetraselmis virus 1]AUF82461.1 hypothetical protein TetV_369 [Tetraselmis virus 1]